MTEPRPAPFAMLRVAAVAYEDLVSLAPPRTAVHVAAALRARAAAEQERPEVEGLLHALIPQVAPGKLRGELLALKRDVHNGRAPSAGPREAARAALPPAARERLDAWLTAQAAASAEELAAEASLREEIDTHLRAGLRRIASQEPFLRALALATPDLCREIQREGGGRPSGLEPSSVDRSLLRYAARAAAKTSPFSSFMHQGPVAVEPDGPAQAWEAGRAIGTARSAISRGLLARIYRAALLRIADGSAVLFRVNSTLRAAAPDQIEGLTGEHVIFEERPWRTEAVGSFRCPPGVVSLLVERAGRSVSRNELLDLLLAGGIDRGRTAGFFGKLLERGIVWELPWTDALDPAPEQGLVAALRSSAGSAVETLRQSVARMAALAAGLSRIDGRDRLATISELSGVVDHALSVSGVAPHAARENQILEDGFLQGVEGSIGEPLARQLLQVGGRIAQQARIAPEYGILREAFLGSFGHGGRCTDVPGFFIDVLRNERAPLDAQVATQPFPTGAPGAPGAPPVAVTLFLQIAAADPATAAEGEGTIVVNQVLDGIGWIAARHAAGDSGDQARLRGWLAAWLVKSMEPREPIDILGRGECSNLQAHPPLTSRVLSWPSEPVRGEPGAIVPLERCALVHDAATGFLELRDPGGRALAPVYLGTTLLRGLGFMSLLMLLSQPFRVLPVQEAAPIPRADEPVVFRPRVESERIVISRATWWIRGRHLRSAWFSRRGAQRLIDVAAERQAHGIPEVFFAQLHAPAEPDRFAALGTRLRKPLWVDTRNPFCLDLLERLALHGKWILLREMLPGAAELWTRIGAKRFVTELHFEMVGAGIP